MTDFLERSIRDLRCNVGPLDRDDAADLLLQMLERIQKLEQPQRGDSAQGCTHCTHPLYAGTKCKNCGRVTEQPQQEEPK